MVSSGFVRPAALLLASILIGAACGASKSPTAASLNVVQVGGDWTGTMALTNVGGGECVGTVYASFVGIAQPFTGLVRQSGATLSATITQHSFGCSYQGTADAESVKLSSTSCDAVQLSLRCPNGPERDLHVVVKTMDGSVAGGAFTGTFSETWNVFEAGTENKVGVLVLNGTFTGHRP